MTCDGIFRSILRLWHLRKCMGQSRRSDFPVKIRRCAKKGAGIFCGRVGANKQVSGMEKVLAQYPDNQQIEGG